MLSVQEFGCIGQACLDVFPTDMRIVVQDLLLGPPGGKKVDDELNGEPRAFDDWFANKDLGVDRDAFAPVQFHRFQDTSRAAGCGGIADPSAVDREYSRAEGSKPFSTTSVEPLRAFGNRRFSFRTVRLAERLLLMRTVTKWKGKPRPFLPMEFLIDGEEEALLVSRVQCGDLAAFEQLLRKVHGPVRKYVVNLAGESEADDVLQEVALRIYREIRHLREPRVFRAWTFRIATRIAFAYLKKAKRWRELENDPELIRSMAGASFNGHERFDSDFLRMVDRVSPASRAVLLLHYQQHLSLEETAAILDIPVGTAKSRLSYGVATIRKFVIGGNHEE